MWNHLTLQIQTNCILFNLTGINCSHLTIFLSDCVDLWSAGSALCARASSQQSLTSFYFTWPLHSSLTSFYFYFWPHTHLIAQVQHFETSSQTLQHFSDTSTLLRHSFKNTSHLSDNHALLQPDLPECQPCVSDTFWSFLCTLMNVRDIWPSRNWPPKDNHLFKYGMDSNKKTRKWAKLSPQSWKSICFRDVSEVCLSSIRIRFGWSAIFVSF